VGDEISGAASAASPIAIWAHHSLVKGSKMQNDYRIVCNADGIYSLVLLVEGEESILLSNHFTEQDADDEMVFLLGMANYSYDSEV